MLGREAPTSKDSPTLGDIWQLSQSEWDLGRGYLIFTPVKQGSGKWNGASHHKGSSQDSSVVVFLLLLALGKSWISG